MSSRLCYTKPSVTELEVRYAIDAAANGWGERCNEYIHRFEEGFKLHLGVDYAIATSSATGALHMGMAALGIGHGDEVILAETNWIASVSPIVHLGATPVFVDILADSWCLDPMQVERAITPRTKAILAVHIYGNLCDMGALLQIGEKYGIPVVEDAAEAIGSVYFGQRAGAMGRFGAFSFHGTKTITTGEGGIFVTNDPDLYQRVLTLSNHGRKSGQKKQFWPEVVGYKYKMSNLQAAIGCGQLERIEELVTRRQQILAEYRKNFACFPEISMNHESKGSTTGAWMPVVVFDRDSGVTRERLIGAFDIANIDARVFFYPLSSLPPFEPRHENKNAWDICGRAINLPSFHDMREVDMFRVCDVVRQVVEMERRG